MASGPPDVPKQLANYEKLTWPHHVLSELSSHALPQNTKQTLQQLKSTITPCQYVIGYCCATLTYRGSIKISTLWEVKKWRIYFRISTNEEKKVVLYFKFPSLASSESRRFSGGICQKMETNNETNNPSQIKRFGFWVFNFLPGLIACTL